MWHGRRVTGAPPLDDRVRCEWPGGNDLLMLAYHDEEWGVPQRDDRALFELLTLEGAQAGLSWATILKRRDGYRRAFEGFDLERIAAYGDEDSARLLADEGIIRNRAKVRATIANAQAALEVQRRHGSLDAYLWSFVGLPAQTEESQRMSKELRERGFSFVGPTICYAFMQAAGLVNDHLTSCYRYSEV
jgi:DNA-3-methyladenine glycosylase I